MASTTSRICNKLDALWDALLLKDMSQNLGQNQAVKPVFLESKQIYLIDHDFSSTTVEDRYPPVLFEPCPQSLLERNPVDIAGYDDSQFGNRVTQFHDYVAGGAWSGVRDCTHLVFSQLESWAYTFTRRDTTSAFVNLQVMRGISPIEEPHGILLSQGFTMSTRDMQWSANMYEHNMDVWEKEPPHVIVLSKQSQTGTDNSIMYGELAQLVTIMRNRACQPEEVLIDEDQTFEDEQEEQDARWPVRSKYVFRLEQRFPALMVSIVGPQHGRIFFACMDGHDDLIIRKSSLFSFERRATAPWDLFARFLLSGPLLEDKHGNLISPRD